MFGTWHLMNRFHLLPSYSYLFMHLHTPSVHQVESGEDPKHQFTFRAQYDVMRNVEADAFFRYIDRLPGLQVGDYKTLDLRLAWRTRGNMEFSLIGQNLLQSHHLEYTPEVVQTMSVQMQRGVFGRIA